MEKPEVYLDNAATTRVCAEAADIACKVMTECYGNPSSTHTKGREAKAYLDTARSQIAAARRAPQGAENTSSPPPSSTTPCAKRSRSSKGAASR